MTNSIKLALLPFVVIFLAACQSVPPLDFTVQDVGMLENRKDAELRSLTVGFAPQSQQGTVDVNHQIPPLWKESLTDALNRSLAFKDDGAKKVNVSVRITRFDVPSFGASMTSEVGAIYEIVDRENGDLLFAETIESEGVIPASYSFMGLTRAMESANRAVRNNIADFINKLESVDLGTPMFAAE